MDSLKIFVFILKEKKFTLCLVNLSLRLELKLGELRLEEGPFFLEFLLFFADALFIILAQKLFLFFELFFVFLPLYSHLLPIFGVCNLQFSKLLLSLLLSLINGLIKVADLGFVLLAQFNNWLTLLAVHQLYYIIVVIFLYFVLLLYF